MNLLSQQQQQQQKSIKDVPFPKTFPYLICNIGFLGHISQFERRHFYVYIPHTKQTYM